MSDARVLDGQVVSVSSLLANATWLKFGQQQLPSINIQKLQTVSC